MTPEFALTLADVRLLQTGRLLEWLAENCSGSETVDRALESVSVARSLVGAALAAHDEATDRQA